MKRDFTQLKEEFTEWYGLSEKERLSRGLPKDIPSFALANDISRQTVYNWIEELGGKEKPAGNFILKDYLNDNLEEIAKSLIHIIKTKKNTKSIELALKSLGELVEKREETHRFELTPDDRINIAIQFRDALRREYQDIGICSVCGQRKAVCIEARLDSEPEQSEDRKVATLALSARPD